MTDTATLKKQIGMQATRLGECIRKINQLTSDLHHAREENKRLREALALSALPPRDELLREALSALEPFAKEAAEWGVNGKPLPDDFQIEVREAGYPATPALFNLGDLRRARAAADEIRASLTQEKQT